MIVYSVALAGTPGALPGMTGVMIGAHLACIGSHGRSRLAKAVLGSVAQSLLAESPRPMLVVRRPSS
jgi:nucleotide-binding universal stress UspA family protein